MQECHRLWPEKNPFEMCEPSRLNMFDKVCGSDIIRNNFVKNFAVADIQNLWMQEIPAFREKVKRYLLYK
jgi:uncharacterized protein YbbC (DUF1343 family)